jgi:ketosteroid isomerase-like protein
LGLIGIALGVSAAALVARSGDGDKQAIATLEYRIVEAIEAKDANSIMANYAKGDSLVVFDVIPPLQYRGREAYLKELAGRAYRMRRQAGDGNR